MSERRQDHLIAASAAGAFPGWLRIFFLRRDRHAAADDARRDGDFRVRRHLFDLRNLREDHADPAVRAGGDPARAARPGLGGWRGPAFMAANFGNRGRRSHCATRRSCAAGAGDAGGAAASAARSGAVRAGFLRAPLRRQRDHLDAADELCRGAAGELADLRRMEGLRQASDGRRPSPFRRRATVPACSAPASTPGRSSRRRSPRSLHVGVILHALGASSSRCCRGNARSAAMVGLQSSSADHCS